MAGLFGLLTRNPQNQMLTKESLSTLAIDENLKSEIGALIDTVNNQKISFGELVEINKSCSKDNDRLRDELTTARVLANNLQTEISDCKAKAESLSLKCQAFSRRFGVNL